MREREVDFCSSILEVKKIEYSVCYIAYCTLLFDCAMSECDGVNLAKLLPSSLHLVSSPSLNPNIPTHNFLLITFEITHF